MLTIFLFFPSIAVAGNTCYQSFDDFLAAFENSRIFQTESAVYPLRHTFIDGGAHPEPKTIESELSKQEIRERKYPIYPYPKDQENISFVKEVAESSTTKRQIMLFKPDTDYVFRYQFEMVNNCWRLTEYNNDSL